jgi:hypothetical protein
MSEMTQVNETEFFQYDTDGALVFHRKETLSGLPHEVEAEMARRQSEAQAAAEKAARVAKLQSSGIADVAHLHK